MAAPATTGPLGAWYEQNPIRRFRRTTGIAIATIADAVGIDKSMINRWEIGTTTPRADMFQSLAAAMGTSPGRLFEDWQAWRAMRPQ